VAEIGTNNQSLRKKKQPNSTAFQELWGIKHWGGEKVKYQTVRVSGWDLKKEGSSPIPRKDFSEAVSKDHPSYP